MNVDFQRRVDRVLGTCMCRLLSLFRRRAKPPATTPNVERVLVILLSEMGSLVLAYPMFERIKKKYPNAALYVLLFKKNKEMLEILEVVPSQHILTMDNSSLGRFAKDGLSVLARLRRARFDVVLDCELFSRVSSILSFLSGAKIRVGFHPHAQEGLYRGDFINRPVLYNPYHHISQQFLTLVEAIDSTTVPKAKRLVVDHQQAMPSITFSRDQIQETARKLQAHAPSAIGKELVLIYPSGGLLPIRAWPSEYYCYLSRQLLGEGYAVGIIGMKEDKGLAEEIQAYCDDPGCIDLTGYTKSIHELMRLFHCAALLVTNDGGPGQFSALTPIPTIVFFGPETPALYAALGRKAVIFHTPLSCSPCFSAYNHRQSPCDGDNLCLKRIEPEQVLVEALKILQTSKRERPADLPVAVETERRDRIVAIEKPDRRVREDRRSAEPS